MSLQDVYREKLEANFNEKKAALNLLKARARRATANGKILAYEELAHAEKSLSEIRGALHKIKDAGGSALAELKTGLGQALNDLKSATRKAAKHLQEAKPRSAPIRPVRTVKPKPATAKKRK